MNKNEASQGNQKKSKMNQVAHEPVEAPRRATSSAELLNTSDRKRRFDILFFSDNRFTSIDLEVPPGAVQLSLS